MGETLRECPLCGSPGEEYQSEFGWEYIRCTDCLMQPGACRTKAEAIAAWNRRASPAPADIAGIEPVAYRQWARVTKRDGSVQKIELLTAAPVCSSTDNDGNSYEYLGEPEPLIPASALARVAQERDALQKIVAEEGVADYIALTKSKHKLQDDLMAAEASLAELRSKFDAAGNYIPNSQIDGDLRAAEATIAALREALTECGKLADAAYNYDGERLSFEEVCMGACVDIRSLARRTLAALNKDASDAE